MMRGKIRRINCIVLFALMAGLLAGCGTKGAESAEDGVVLEEPVGISANYDVAVLRDLYDYKIYASVVAPYVTEYGFDKDQRFKKFGAVPGETVTKGAPLIYTETKDIDRQIEEMEEAISDFEADHATELEALQKDLSDATEAQYEVGQGYASLFEFEPDKALEEAHAGWEAMAMGPEGAFRRAKQARERVEQSIKENRELYELEHQYKLDSLARLQNKVTDATLTAKEDGVIVNWSDMYGGQYVNKDVSLIAVGDPSVKVLRTAYLSKSTVAKAEDLYAIVDGERYEVVQEPMEQEEYNRLVQDEETVYSTFYLQDPDDKLRMGQYAVLVYIKESRKDVLCIPIDAVKVEKDASYCYVYDGENSVYTAIETGMKDGVYVEVLSGLKEGDKVLSAEGVAMGKNKKTLEIGECGTEFSANGYLYYLFSELLENPVDQGRTYVKEVFVTEYQAVSEGDVLMTLEVVSDDIEIGRCNRRLERLADRLTKLQKKKSENDGRKIVDRATERAITANMKETDLIRRKLEKLTKYSGIVEVKAPADGIVMSAGFVTSDGRYYRGEMPKEGALIEADASLMRFSDASSICITVDDDKGVLAYGNEALVEYVDDKSARQQIRSTVVMVGNSSASKDLTKEWTLIAVPEEQKEFFSGSRVNDLGAWSRNSFKVTVQTRSMDHVVLIPKAAVTMAGGSTYVNVVEEDGTVARKTFIAGGSNNNYYWAVSGSGLHEGMNICWE